MTESEEVLFKKALTEEVLSKKGLIAIGIVSFLILIIGGVLLLLGYNEAFYVESFIVQIIFGIITFSGNSLILILVIATFCFIYDKRFAKNFFFMYIFSGVINTAIKDVVRDPRPASNISSRFTSSGYGFPSGHAQVAVTNWGYTAYHFKDKLKPLIVPIIFSIFIFLIAVSRIIIGVHDLQDIVGGLLIGIAILVLFLHLEPTISEKVNSLGLSMKIMLGIITSLLIAIIGSILFPISGYGINIYAISGGSLCGLSIGYVLEKEFVDYKPSELSTKQKVINLTVGIVLLMIYLIFMYGFIIGTDFHEFVRNAILSFIITFVIPLIFTKINRK